jgi:hypothetical protein
MSNTFITPTLVARDAAIASAERLVVGNLVSRNKEGLFTASKVGDEVKVTIPPAVTDASEFNGTTAASDQTETEVRLKLEKHFYKRIDLTSKQKSLELSDFTRLVTVPAVTGIMDSVDKFITRKMQVFRRNLTGTVGNRPSTMAHIAAATQKLNDLRVMKAGRVALIDTTVEQSFSQLAQFQSQDYGADAPAGLREAVLGRRYDRPDELFARLHRLPSVALSAIATTSLDTAATLAVESVERFTGFLDRVKEELIVYARFRYGATAFSDIGPIDEQELRSYLEDALSEATAKAWREIR